MHEYCKLILLFDSVILKKSFLCTLTYISLYRRYIIITARLLELVSHSKRDKTSQEIAVENAGGVVCSAGHYLRKAFTGFRVSHVSRRFRKCLMVFHSNNSPISYAVLLNGWVPTITKKVA